MNNRQLPFLDKVVILINGAFGLVSLILLLISSLLIILMIDDVDYAEIKYLNDDVLIGTGVITEIFETGTTINDEIVYGYDYTFFSPIGELYWTSYKLGYIYEIGDTVQVEYSNFKPGVNRIKGMNNTPGGLLSLLFLIPFLVGLISFVLLGMNVYSAGIAVPEIISFAAVATVVQISAIKIYFEKH